MSPYTLAALTEHYTNSLARADHTDSSLLLLVRQTFRAMLLRVLNDCCALSQIIRQELARLIVTRRFDCGRGAIDNFCASTRILFRNHTAMAYNLRNGHYKQFLCQYLSIIWLIVFFASNRLQNDIVVRSPVLNSTAVFVEANYIQATCFSSAEPSSGL
jgi:hypothetical protein